MNCKSCTVETDNSDGICDWCQEDHGQYPVDPVSFKHPARSEALPQVSWSTVATAATVGFAFTLWLGLLFWVVVP